jgi:sugar O-acyltransferase (sialic acid O-acetyltransferase NeuD family)
VRPDSFFEGALKAIHMARPLIIVGTGGNASDILDAVEAGNTARAGWEVVGFLDDARPAGERVYDLEVLGPLRRAIDFRGGHRFINAIGSDRSFRRRPAIIDGLGLTPDDFATVVHPGASVSRRAVVGRGVCINACVSVGGGVSLGDHVWLGAGCAIGHDTAVGDFSVVAPGAVVSGFVRVGRCCYLGSRAAVRPGVMVEAECMVGMGAVVLRDVAAGTTVVGNPARVLRPRGAAVPGRAESGAHTP